MTAPPSSPRKGKRLLVAAVGVATVSFAACDGCGPRVETITSGNLMPTPAQEAGAEPVTVSDAGHEQLPGSDPP
jgi:glycerate-2-kinase